MKIGRFLDKVPPWENEDPKARLEAVTKADPPQDTLESLAATDNDQSVRLAAIDKLENTEFVLSLAQASDGEQRRRAAARWTALVCNSDTAGDAISTVDAPAVLAEFARSATTTELRLQAVARIDDDAALATILAEDNHSRVHQACAERVQSEDQLDRVKKLFLDKDKGVHQIARDKLAAIRDARARQHQLASRAEEACTALEALAANAHETALARRLDVLEMRWQEIVHEDTEATLPFLERTNAAIAACRQRAEAEVEAKQSATREAEAVMTRVDDLAAALAASEDRLPQLAAELEAIHGAWPAGVDDDSELAQRYKLFTAAAERAAALFQQIEAVVVDSGDIKTLRGALSDYDWPADFVEPAKVETIRARLSQLIDADEKEKAQRDQRIKTTHNQLAEFEKKIEDGNLKGSNKAHATIAKSFREHGAVLPRSLNDEFSRLTGRLTELRDWHRFVTNPKRQELCEQMEALATDEDMHPPKKAKEIKQLQEAWKGLGPSDNREAQELWSRFKTASDNAYQPCAAFFEEQKSVRDDNLKAREAICAELETFNQEHDWTNPDYKAVGGLIARSLKSWREAGEVPRAKFKKVSDRFNKAMEPLQERLSNEHERNQQQKSALVNLVASYADDTGTALVELIEKTKQAQRDWQAIGPAERRKEQKLWKSFRRECDRLFARRDAQRDAARKEESSAKGECGQIIDRLKQRISQGDIERGEIRQFRNAFEEAARQAGKGAPRKAFQGALKQAERVIEQRAVAGQRLEVDEMRRRAALCRSLESGEMTAEALDAEWEGDVELSSALAERIEARREGAATLTDAARAENLESAALLCVRAEILAGIESPPEAQSLRMQYQVERLNRELSQGQKDHRTPQEQLRDLQIDWFSLGGIPAGQDDLIRRFAAAEEKLAR